jgi:hypothetical protein
MTKTNKRRPLTDRQQRFCELVASGESQTNAWLLTGYKVSRDVARRNAAESMTKPDIAARVAKLRMPHTASAALSKARKHELLMQIAENVLMPPNVRISAIAEDSKLAGHYSPEQHVLETGSDILKTARERALAIASPLNRFAKKNGGDQYRA